MSPFPSGQVYSSADFDKQGFNASPLHVNDPKAAVQARALQAATSIAPGLTVYVDSMPAKGIRGGMFALAIELYRTGDIRVNYDDLVVSLKTMGVTEEWGNKIRDALQREFNNQQTTLGKSFTKQIRTVKPKTRTNYASPNAVVTARARVMCRIGGGIALVGFALDVIDIARAPEGEKLLVAAKTAGRMAGAAAGFKAGALLCAWGGPYGIGICGFALGVVGGIAGDAAVGKLLEPGFVEELFESSFRAQKEFRDLTGRPFWSGPKY